MTFCREASVRHQAKQIRAMQDSTNLAMAHVALARIILRSSALIAVTVTIAPFSGLRTAMSGKGRILK